MKFYLVLALRVTVGIIFAASGVGKLLDIPSFSITIEEFHILPQPFVLPFSIFVPIVEVLLGSALVAGVFLKQASFGLGVLLISFLIAIGVSLVKGNPVSCGCAGVLGSDSVTLSLLLKDVGLLCSLLFLRFYDLQKTNINESVSSKLSSLKAVALYAVSTVAAFAFFKGDELINVIVNRTEPAKLNKRSHANSVIQYGSPAPSFRVTDIQGKEITSVDKGRTSIFIVVPRSAARDRTTAALLQYCGILSQAYHKNGFRPYGIFQGKAEDAANYAKDFHLTFQMVADSLGVVSNLFRASNSLVTTIIVDRDGIVRYAAIGILEEQILRQLIEKELFGTPRYFAKNRNAAALKEGDTFPNITIEDVDTGEQRSLYSMFHSYAIVAYFSSNCGCSSENRAMFFLNGVVKNLGEHGATLPVIGVFGTKYAREQITHLRESGHAIFPVYSSTEILSGDHGLMESADPLIVLVDQKHKISLFLNLDDNESSTMSKVYSIIKEDEGT